MKITIIDKEPDEADEIIVKCSSLDEGLVRFINTFKSTKNGRISFYKDDRIVFLKIEEIYYFDYVDHKVFAYTKDEVFQCRLKLYELEDLLKSSDFFRASKSVLVNLKRLKSLSPAFGGRFEALLDNGYKIIISRMYVQDLKDKLEF